VEVYALACKTDLKIMVVDRLIDFHLS
jgi:hypothetical protein